MTTESANHHRDNVQHRLTVWCLSVIGLPESTPCTLDVVSGDASFRCYYRLHLSDQDQFIAVHAPPEKENNAEFIAVQQRLSAADIRVPGLLGWDLQQGFMLQEDFGDRLLLPLLTDVNAAEPFYDKALDSLLAMQRIPLVEGDLPDYDYTRLTQEMALFPQWFVESMLGLELHSEDHTLLAQCFDTLAKAALAQPQGFVHRDFHSRNIMVLDDGELGFIDFQDAVRGPLTYDLVSLLRDCYIRWPEASVAAWRDRYYSKAQAAGLALPDAAQFAKDMDWMGLQRHLKVLGIFARLSIRDGKHGYLNDLPLVMHYTLSVARRYEELAPFVAWFERRLMPSIQSQPWYQDSYGEGYSGSSGEPSA